MQGNYLHILVNQVNDYVDLVYDYKEITDHVANYDKVDVKQEMAIIIFNVVKSKRVYEVVI